jgi:asparagine synthetase B (glutamine-hydrolysing)
MCGIFSLLSYSCCCGGASRSPSSSAHCTDQHQPQADSYHDSYDSEDTQRTQRLIDLFRDGILNRGPDGFSTASISNTDLADCVHGGIQSCVFGASVLHIQGTHITRQPYIDVDENILCWNGEVFGGIVRDTNVSDTVLVAALLRHSINNITLQPSSLESIGNAIVSALSIICGPYAFVYYHKKTQSLFYGRDPFGRRSLCVCIVNGRLHAVSSVLPLQLSSSAREENDNNDGERCPEQDAVPTIATPAAAASRYVVDPLEKWEEVSVSGIFGLFTASSSATMNEQIMDDHASIGHCVHIPWPVDRLRLERNSLCRQLALQRQVHCSIDVSTLQITPSRAVESENDLVSSSPVPRYLEFLNLLIDAVSRRLRCLHSDPITTSAHTNYDSQGKAQPSCSSSSASLSSSASAASFKMSTVSCGVGVLFSGGIDSVLLAAVLHLALDQLEKDSINSTLAVELINVSFETEDKSRPPPARWAAFGARDALPRLFPSREWRLVHVDVVPSERQACESRVRQLIQPADTHMDLNIGTAFWFAGEFSNGIICRY